MVTSRSFKVYVNIEIEDGEEKGLKHLQPKSNVKTVEFSSFQVEHIESDWPTQA